MNESSEKRDAAREPITLRVDYKRLNMFFADYTKNISKGGTFIKTKNPLPIGTEFVFVLSFPHVERTLQLSGEVVWIDSGEGEGSSGEAGMGIRFNFKTEEERRQVARFVEGMMSDTLGEHLSNKLLGKT
jgi:type IV pilus assembly protein PilZ